MVGLCYHMGTYDVWACANVKGLGDIEVQGVAESHIWIHGPPSARVYVHVSYL